VKPLYMSTEWLASHHENGTHHVTIGGRWFHRFVFTKEVQK
jgi:hypothetical protein